jgi:hypothetical protein
MDESGRCWTGFLCRGKPTQWQFLTEKKLKSKNSAENVSKIVQETKCVEQKQKLKMARFWSM